MTGTWINCPMFQKYAETKRTYIKELRLEKWKEAQQIELWNAIRIAFSDVCDPKKEYWIRRLYSYYSIRFNDLTKCSWLIFLSKLDDTAAYGKYKQEKAKEYCCKVRDTAWWLTHQTEEVAQICEPEIIFEYDVAA